ncbi:MAG: ABC transporter permease, partial [Oscillospiraceae bacterium]|nr:ABC transporter permease [Oscillospiraceae bacterium]
GGSAWDYISYLFFPALAVALPRIAMTVRLLRGCILQEAKKDYVRTSMSRGRSRGDILYRHVLKNTLVPLITYLAMTVADLFAGSVIIEQVFSVPGIGRLLLTSIFNRDYPVAEAIVVILAFWVVLCNLLGDLLSRRIDPRLESGEGGGV